MAALNGNLQKIQKTRKLSVIGGMKVVDRETLEPIEGVTEVTITYEPSKTRQFIQVNLTLLVDSNDFFFTPELPKLEEMPLEELAVAVENALLTERMPIKLVEQSPPVRFPLPEASNGESGFNDDSL